MCRAAEKTHGRRRAGHKFTLSHISSPYRFRQRRKTRPTSMVRAFISACFRQRNMSVRSVRPALQRRPVLEYSRHVLHKCALLQSGIHFRTKAASGKRTGVLVLIVSLHEGLVAPDVLFSEFFMSASFFSFFFLEQFCETCTSDSSHSIARLGKAESCLCYFESLSFFFASFDRREDCVYI